MTEEAVASVREAAPMNILIVDDESAVRDTCAEVARQSGMKATAVASAEDALEVLERSAIDILLTDLSFRTPAASTSSSVFTILIRMSPS